MEKKYIDSRLDYTKKNQTTRTILYIKKTVQRKTT